MSFKRGMAVFAWINLTLLIWAIILYPPIRENPAPAVWGCVIFFFLGVIFSVTSSDSITEKKESKDEPTGNDQSSPPL